MKTGIFTLFFAVLLCCSCTRTMYVPVESVRTEYRDRVDYKRDSVFLRDSILVMQRGDTVFRDRWHIEYRDRLLHDSIFITKSDSIPVPYPVEKKLSRWEQAKQNAGGVAIGGILIIIAAAVIWLIKKFRK